MCFTKVARLADVSTNTDKHQKSSQRSVFYITIPTKYSAFTSAVISVTHFTCPPDSLIRDLTLLSRGKNCQHPDRPVNTDKSSVCAAERRSEPSMLRRPATTLQITSEDVAAYEDRRAREALVAQQQQHEEELAAAQQHGGQQPPSPDAEEEVRRQREARIGVRRG